MNPRRERVAAADSFIFGLAQARRAAQDFDFGHWRAGLGASWPGPGRSCARCGERPARCCRACGEGSGSRAATACAGLPPPRGLLTLPRAPPSFGEHGNRRRLRSELGSSVKGRGGAGRWGGVLKAPGSPQPASVLLSAALSSVSLSPSPGTSTLGRLCCPPHPHPKLAGERPVGELGELPHRRARPVADGSSQL